MASESPSEHASADGGASPRAWRSPLPSQAQIVRVIVVAEHLDNDLALLKTRYDIKRNNVYDWYPGYLRVSGPGAFPRCRGSFWACSTGALPMIRLGRLNRAGALWPWSERR